MTKILVIGESCLDEYIYGTCNRVCPEAAALCFCRNNYPAQTNIGMAGNVLNNLKAIDKSLTYDFISNDLKINPIIKRRFIDTKYNTIVFREDINDSCSSFDISKFKLCDYNIIIISDYNKGFLSFNDYRHIRQASPRATIFADTKKTINTDITDNVNFLKINSHEYSHNVDAIKNIPNMCSLIVTYGDEGCRLYDMQGVRYFPTTPINIRDVSGAGDTFLAALVIRYHHTNDITQSIIFANQQAGIVVQKFGVSTP